MFAAWRLLLDHMDRGKIGFNEFANACRQIGFQGEIRKIWHELDDDNGGTITFEEFAPYVARELERFRVALRASAGGSLVREGGLYPAAYP